MATTTRTTKSRAGRGASAKRFESLGAGRSVIKNKTDEDLIVFLNGRYYYLTSPQLKKAAAKLGPSTIEASRAEALRSRGALVAHMDEEFAGVGYWTTLVNLDAIIAGEHATHGRRRSRRAG